VIALTFRAVLLIGTLLAALAVSGLAQPPRLFTSFQESAP
jgi:hypothetical protein